MGEIFGFCFGAIVIFMILFSICSFIFKIVKDNKRAKAFRKFNEANINSLK